MKREEEEVWKKKRGGRKRGYKVLEREKKGVVGVRFVHAWCFLSCFSLPPHQTSPKTGGGRGGRGGGGGGGGGRAEKKQHQESLLRNKFCKVLEGKKEKQYSTFRKGRGEGKGREERRKRGLLLGQE